MVKHCVSCSFGVCKCMHFHPLISGMYRSMSISQTLFTFIMLKWSGNSLQVHGVCSTGAYLKLFNPQIPISGSAHSLSPLHALRFMQVYWSFDDALKGGRWLGKIFTATFWTCLKFRTIADSLYFRRGPFIIAIQHKSFVAYII